MKFNLRDLKSPKKETYKLVGFKVRDILYGIDIMSVCEVINPIDLMAVPSLPSYVKGVADHRGEVIPIIDLRARFGMDAAGETSKIKWLIIKVEEKDVGLEVDWVTEVVAVSPSDKRDQLPSTYLEKPWIKDVYQSSGHLVFELDLKAVVHPATLELEGDDGHGRTP